jgi:thymidylate kinase
MAISSTSRYGGLLLVLPRAGYLDVPVEVGLRRKAGGSGDAWNRMEQKEIAFHERVRAGYLAMAAQEPDRWAVVDAMRDIYEVQATIRELVTARQSSKASVEEEGVK